LAFKKINPSLQLACKPFGNTPAHHFLHPLYTNNEEIFVTLDLVPARSTGSRKKNEMHKNNNKKYILKELHAIEIIIRTIYINYSI